MNETTLAFGANAGLVGTLSAVAPHAAGIGGLLFNAGVVPRIGPNRLNVRIARALAASGIPSLRFDISGRGDSAPARGMESYEQQAVADIRAAMNLLNERTGASRFALMGICSGAENAFHAALADERVVGVTLMDSYHYPTLRTHFNRFRQRADMQGGVCARDPRGSCGDCAAAERTSVTRSRAASARSARHRKPSPRSFASSSIAA